MKKFSFFLLVFSFFTSHSIAQRSLTEQDKKYIETQAISYIKVFLYNIEKIGSSNNLSDRQKEILVKFTLSYFQKDATMEVMNLKGKDTSTNTYQMEHYLQDIVANYDKRFQTVYTKIITSSFNLDNLVPIKDANGNITSYKGVFSYVQGFCAKKGPVVDREIFNSKDANSYDVCEKTWKEGEVIIEKKYSPTVGNRWVILLGDIEAKRIENLKSS